MTQSLVARFSLLLRHPPSSVPPCVLPTSSCYLTGSSQGASLYFDESFIATLSYAVATANNQVWKRLLGEGLADNDLIAAFPHLCSQKSDEDMDPAVRQQIT